VAAQAPRLRSRGAVIADAVDSADEKIVRPLDHTRRPALRPAPARLPTRDQLDADPLSPELVLVSPELRLRALATLPDRPWELFAPPRPAPSPPAPAPETLAQAAVTPVVAPVEMHSPVRSRSRRPVMLLLACLIIGFVAGLLVKRPAQPTFIESAAGPAATSAPRTTATTAVSPTAPTPTLAHSAAVAGGGYVFGREGRFQIGASLRTVRLFHARVRCARSVSVKAIPLTRGGRFAYHARVRGRGGAKIRLDVVGRFVRPARASGFVRARAGTCDSGKVRFLAKLS
jgi:hypothetical protein